MTKHGGAGRAGTATAVAFVTLLAGLALSAGGASAAGGPISGTPEVGETLTASPAQTYHWQRCDPLAGPCTSSGAMWILDQGWTDIPGAQGHNDRQYKLTAADAGMMIRVLSNQVHLGRLVASPAVGPVTVAVPVNLTPPSIEGQAIEGTTLTGNDGTWSGDDLTFTRQWQRSNGSGGWDDIAGATESDYTLVVADVNRRVRLRVVASNSGGDSEPAFSAPTDVVVNPPEFDSSGNLDPVSGTVLAKVPGAGQVQEIRELTQVPTGTTVDASDGFVDLTTQRGPGEGLQTITLWKGTFVFGQRLKNRITVMRLTDGLTGATGRAARTQAQAAGKAGKRRLWGRGRCRCRTRGRNSSGTARGTYWLTAERKKGTLTKVKEGTVAVRDFTQNRRVLVHAGERYFAPAH
jgi:hypothetical protein